METLFVRNECITYDYDIDLGHGNVNFVLDTPFHYALLLFNILLNSLQLF